MKLKVLIVDQDARTRAYMQSLIRWEAHGFELLPLMADGKAALRLYRMELPDIIFTNTCLSGMDGFELVREIRRLEEKVYIVFLAETTDFDQIRRALRLGASDYLLKTELTDTCLLEKLSQCRMACGKWHMAWRTRFEYEVAQRVITNTEPMITEDMDYHTVRSLCGKYFAAIIERDTPIETFTGTAGLLTNQGMDYVLVRELCYSVELTGWAFPIHLTANRFLLLYLDYTEKPADVRHQRFLQSLDYVERSLRINLGERFCVFCFDEEYKLSVLIHKYQEARKKLAYKYFIKKRRILALTALPPGGHLDKKPDIRNIKNAVEERSSESVHRAFREIVYPAVENRDVHYLRKILPELLIYVKDLFTEQYDPSDGQDMELFDDHCQVHWYTYLEAVAWLEEKLCVWVNVVVNSAKKKYSPSVLLAVEYIREHYADVHLDMEALAEHAQISKSRLGVLFKKDTGKTVVEYLTAFRIIKSKQLLQNSYKMFEVAAMTGFSSSQYYCKVFKRMEGISPSEYRNGEPI